MSSFNVVSVSSSPQSFVTFTVYNTSSPSSDMLVGLAVFSTVINGVSSVNVTVALSVFVSVRSELRRVVEECGLRCRSQCSPYTERNLEVEMFFCLFKILHVFGIKDEILRYSTLTIHET